MPSFAKITIVGHLGRDPESKHTPQGNAVCKFPIAATERRKNAQGEPEEVTTWFRVTVWGRQAEFAAEYLSKGRLCYVEGRVRLETFTDRDGRECQSLEVTASDVQALGGKDESRAQAAAVGSSRDPQAIGQRKQGRVQIEVDESDVPF